MRRIKQGLFVAAAVACVASAPGVARAATDAQIVNAIDNGLAWLDTQQTAGGYWNYGGYEQAATGAAVGAFMAQQSHWGSNTAAYQAVVDNAMNYLLSTASTNTVGVRSDGFNPCGSGTCDGVFWNGNGEATYTTGLVASAVGQYAASKASTVATTSGPLAGKTWTQIAQGVTNEFAYGQSTAASGDRRGGWRYFPGSGDSDSSTTQWAVLSMIYDQSLGATTPGFVKNELKYWLTAAQNPVTGAGCYQPGSFCDHSDTGSLLIGHSFVGDGTSNSAVQAALGFLNANWTEGANGTWFGNFGQPYAMWATYKALELQIGKGDTTTITNLLDSQCGGPANPPATTCNWWQDYNQWLVTNQSGDGSWPGYAYWTGPLATAFDVSILAGTEIPPPCTGVECPEPASLSLMGAGILGMGLLRRRRQHA